MDNKLGAMEMRFAQLIWENEPINSGELVKLCEKELSWKKSTTYTMLRRLCQRGIFQIGSKPAFIIIHVHSQSPIPLKIICFCIFQPNTL